MSNALLKSAPLAYIVSHSVRESNLFSHGLFALWKYVLTSPYYLLASSSATSPDCHYFPWAEGSQSYQPSLSLSAPTSSHLIR